MWNKPWTMKEGFLIGGGLIVIGLILELCVGPVVWETFAWPVNGIVLAIFVTIIAVMHLLRAKFYAFRFLSTYQAAIPVMCYAVVLTIMMGLTRQTSNGRGLTNMLSFWPFVLTYVYMAVIVGLVVLKSRLNTKTPSKIVAGIFHLGLFITMTTATLGNADMQRLKMYTMVGEPEWRAINERMEVVELPLAIQLDRFIMEEWQGEGIDQHTPKRFASQVQVLTQNGKNIHATIEVNKPLSIDGWKIYQYGYDTAMGARSQTSIFELVADPWMPFVYVGIYLMLAGAVLVFITAQRIKEDEP